MHLRGASQIEASLKEKYTDCDAGYHAGQSDNAVEVASGDAYHHPDRAAEEYQGAYHDKHAEKKANYGGRTTGRTPFLEGEGGYHGTNYESEYFGAQKLDYSGAVNSDGTCDVAKKTGNAYAHVGRVTPVGHQRRQHAEDYTGADYGVSGFKKPSHLFLR